MARNIGCEKYQDLIEKKLTVLNEINEQNKYPDGFKEKITHLFEEMKDHLNSFSRKLSDLPENADDYGDSEDAENYRKYQKEFIQEFNKDLAECSNLIDEYQNVCTEEKQINAADEFMADFLKTAADLSKWLNGGEEIRTSVELASAGITVTNINAVAGEPVKDDLHSVKPGSNLQDVKARAEKLRNKEKRLSENETVPEAPDYDYNEMIPLTAVHFADMLSVDHFKKALDDHGKEYRNPQEAAEKLKNPDETLYIYVDEEEYPYAVHYEDEKGLTVSTFTVSPVTPLNAKFRPAASLKRNDILAGMRLDHDPGSVEADSLLQTAASNKRAAYEAMSANHPDQAYELSRNAFLKKVNMEREMNHLEPLYVPGEAPERPAELSAGQKFARGLLKLITLGIADTKASKDHKKEMKDYEERLARYNKNKDAYESVELLRYDDNGQKYKVRMVDELKRLKHSLGENYKDRQQTVIDDRAQMRKEYEKEEEKINRTYRDRIEFINNYQNNIEVRLEGVKDINKHRVTQDNLFAEIWRLEGDLEGRKYQVLENAAEMRCRRQDIVNELKQIGKGAKEKALKDELAQINKTLEENDALEEKMAKYILARTIQEKITSADFNIRQSRTSSEQLIKSLNDRTELHRVIESTPFQDMLRYMSEKSAITTRDLMEEYHEASKREPGEKLKLLRQNLIDDFGKKVPSARCMNDVFRLNLIDECTKNIRKIINNYRTLHKNFRGSDADIERKLVADVYRPFKEDVNYEILKPAYITKYSRPELQRQFVNWAGFENTKKEMTLVEMQQKFKDWSLEYPMDQEPQVHKELHNPQL